MIPHNLMMPVNQLEGIQQDIPRVIGAMPAVTGEDYENIVFRLQGIAPLVDQTIALMERGLAAGMTPPSDAVRDFQGRSRARSSRIRTEPAARSVPAVAVNGSRGGPCRSRGTRESSAYEPSARPAFQKLHDFLVKRYLPACRQSTDAKSLPDGAKFLCL